MARQFTDGGFMHGADFNAAIDGAKLRGVKSGCAVTANPDVDPNEWRVTVGAGVIHFDSGLEVAVAQQDLVHDDPGANRRYDLVVVDSAGVASIVKSLVDKAAPDLPTDKLLLSVDHIDPAEIQIAQGEIADARIFVTVPRTFVADLNDESFVATVENTNAGADAHVLLVEGASADAAAKLVEILSGANPRFTVFGDGAVHVPGKLGLGNALDTLEAPLHIMHSGGGAGADELLAMVHDNTGAVDPANTRTVWQVRFNGIVGGDFRFITVNDFLTGPKELMEMGFRVNNGGTMEYVFLATPHATDATIRIGNSGNFNVFLGSQGLATGATVGHAVIPSTLGTPTGDPSSIGNQAAILYDRTNEKIMVYDVGTDTWKGVAVA